MMDRRVTASRIKQAPNASAAHVIERAYVF
jgi:hypothetical protein